MRNAHENVDWAFGVSLSLSLRDDATGHISLESDDRGMSYRASAQRAPTPQRYGWRARASAGAAERIDASATSRGSLGDSTVQAAVVNGVAGARVSHSGSAGWIEGLTFAGRPVKGAFALIDVGAQNVAVTRDRLYTGVTGADGRILATNLRAYDINTIGIAADDLPFDRAPASTTQAVTPAEGAGVVIRFQEAVERLRETRVYFEDGVPAERGAVLVRERDGARFPVGSGGRVVLQGAADSDIVRLDANLNCAAAADETAAREGLILVCAAALS
jgi:outer membrane usher protein